MPWSSTRTATCSVPAVPACSLSADRDRSASTRTLTRRRPPAAPSPASGCRFPATGPGSRTTAASPCSVGGRCASTPAARRSSQGGGGGLETHPAVRDSTVVGVPDPAFGEEVPAVVSPRRRRPGHGRGPDRPRQPHRRVQGAEACADRGRRGAGPERQGGLRRHPPAAPRSLVSPIPRVGRVRLREASKGSPVSPGAAPEIDEAALKARYRQQRDLITDDVRVAISGGGFAGLLAGAPARRGRAHHASASSTRAGTSAEPGTGAGDPVPLRSRRRRAGSCAPTGSTG